MGQAPSYSTSRQALWLSSAAAWLILFGITIGAIMGSEQCVALANIAFPSLILLISSMLGIHRHYGSKDMKTMADKEVAEQVVEKSE